MLRMDLELRRDEGFHLRLELEAPAGFTVLYGPSGAGKSTVLDCVAGALRPDRGRVELDGRVLVDTAAGVFLPPRRRRTPRVYQDGRLFPHRSVRENLLYGAPDADGLDEVAAMLEIADLLHRRPTALSGGQRQRVAVGRALLARPRALLLDEPLASLDRPLRRRILPALRGVADRFAIPLLYVTHSLEEALVLGRQVAVLEEGRMAALGPPARVLAHGPDGPEAEVAAGDTVLEVSVSAHHPAEGITDCRLGEAILRASLLPAAEGERLFLALSPRDVILARHRPAGLSARNALPARVERMEDEGDRRRACLRLDGSGTAAPTLDVLLTPDACAELGVGEGSETWAVFKSSALRPVGPAA